MPFRMSGRTLHCALVVANDTGLFLCRLCSFWNCHGIPLSSLPSPSYSPLSLVNLSKLGDRPAPAKPDILPDDILAGPSTPCAMGAIFRHDNVIISDLHGLTM